MPFGFIKSIFHKVDTLVPGRGRIDEDLLEELESALLAADVNVHTTGAALADLRTAAREDRLRGPDEVKARLRASLSSVLTAPGIRSELRVAEHKPTVYLVVGVNGVGKTTSIGKLACLLVDSGHRVVLAAADTFRAAAIDQIKIWGARAKCDVISHSDGSDPGAVVFDAVAAAKARGAEYVIVDTAGRLHTRSNLMEELKKINRVLERELGRTADEVLLVVDATTGQNAISQAREFSAAVPLTGLILAKLDGTARGGIVITLAADLRLPIKLVGTGEKPGDLEPFDADAFVTALLA